MTALKNRYRQLRKQWKSIRNAWGRRIWDKVLPEVSLAEPKKVLLMRHDGRFGDCLISSFVARELKKQWPNMQVDVLAAPNLLDLLELNPYLDNIIPFAPKKRLQAFLRMGSSLSNQGYDVVIDPTANIDTRQLVLLRSINAKVYAGYDKSTFGLFNLNIAANDAHMIEVYAQILKRLGCDDVHMQFEVPSTNKSQAAIAAYVQQLPHTDYVAVNLYGTSSSRQFSVDRAVQMLTYFQQQNPQWVFVLLGLPSKQHEIEAICQRCHHDYIRYCPNISSIFDNIELIRHSKGIVSLDTAIVHIAAAMNKNMVVFYHEEAENFAKWRPFTNQPYELIRYADTVNSVDFTQVDFKYF